MLVAVVGVCASGKTTLVKQLQQLGIEAYTVAQEHSGVKRLWQRRNPDYLVMLDATLPVVRRRRNVAWDEERLTVQRERLKNARQHADLFIQTDALSKEEVVQTVLSYLRRNSQ